MGRYGLVFGVSGTNSVINFGRFCEDFLGVSGFSRLSSSEHLSGTEIKAGIV